MRSERAMLKIAGKLRDLANELEDSSIAKRLESLVDEITDLSKENCDCLYSHYSLQDAAEMHKVEESVILNWIEDGSLESEEIDGDIVVLVDESDRLLFY